MYAGAAEQPIVPRATQHLIVACAGEDHVVAFCLR
jgi:hypothetical protein